MFSRYTVIVRKKIQADIVFRVAHKIGVIKTSVLRIEIENLSFTFQGCVHTEQISMLILKFKTGNIVSDFNWNCLMVFNQTEIRIPMYII